MACGPSNGILRHVTFNASVWAFFGGGSFAGRCRVTGRASVVKRLAFVRFIGKISYGIYLTHAFFPRIFESSAVIERMGSALVWAQAICVLVLSVAVLLKLKERWESRPGAGDKALEVPALPPP